MLRTIPGTVLGRLVECRPLNSIINCNKERASSSSRITRQFTIKRRRRIIKAKWRHIYDKPQAASGQLALNLRFPRASIHVVSQMQRVTESRRPSETRINFPQMAGAERKIVFRESHSRNNTAQAPHGSCANTFHALLCTGQNDTLEFVRRSCAPET